jgi:hypothetical protein
VFNDAALHRRTKAGARESIDDKANLVFHEKRNQSDLR